VAEWAADKILRSRRRLINRGDFRPRSPEAAEGGCGVLGLAANLPIAGRHLLPASQQMHNRGNGKGGGIAMAGLDPRQQRVDADTLRSHYLVQVAYLEPSARGDVEQQFILPQFDVAQGYIIDHFEDHQQVPGLEIQPPEVWRYFVRPSETVLARFAEEHTLGELPSRAIEDEFVFQNSLQLNRTYYASLGEKRAFVLSHGRDLVVLKIVGYAEQVVQYYQLEDQVARVWIAHQRYPTKGRVWHPGGAHPFVGLNEALVHNGDFANYHSLCEYLRQRNIPQLFLTDTEVGVQLFDLWDRVYRYPLEITLEAMAPTTEHDFSVLPPKKQQLYRAVQAAHMHGSPDGPWFFILARSFPDEDRWELLGITDTSMLRPQVFALYENLVGAEDSVQIGLIASERQAIHACLRSLSAEDARFQALPDRTWVARGGSHTDGGAFRFSVSRRDGLVCADKFERPVRLAPGEHFDRRQHGPGHDAAGLLDPWQRRFLHAYDNGGPPEIWPWWCEVAPQADWRAIASALQWLEAFAGASGGEWEFAFDLLTLLRDRPAGLGGKKRASLLALLDERLENLLDRLCAIEDANGHLASRRRLTWEARHSLRPPEVSERGLALDTRGFPPEGDDSAARWLVRAHAMGWRHLIAYRWRGGRFAACGLGPASAGTRLDLYGDVGDYAASGLDGAEVHLHGDGQDQVGQILKSGMLVIHGDVGQTFLYGAKGGEVYVRGSAAGRPLINATGRPRAVINGTCLDYLAESFMAGDPLRGGGFAIVNGVTTGDDGRLQPLDSPYPGGNLFSLASGGTVYLRDPKCLVSEAQLNGGVFAELSGEDWALLEPYLLQNERLFGICLQDLLTVEGQLQPPRQVYRRVQVGRLEALHEREEVSDG